MAPKKRITEDSDLEKILDEPGWKDAPTSRVNEIIQAARNSVAKRRGGARPGAGRKALGKVRLYTNVLPQTLAFLEKAAGGSRGMGAVLDGIVAGFSPSATLKSLRAPTGKKAAARR